MSACLKKICVVGAGNWGKNHLRTLHELGSLAGLVDSNPKTCLFFQKKYPKIRIHSTLEAALSDNFDGFTVATPAETHFSIAKEIIMSSKPILVEKPLALCSKEAFILNELAIKKNVTLIVGHLLLFHPAIIKMKELIDQGKIGKLEYLYSNRLNLGTVRTKENILWSFAPHDISIFQYFVGKIPLRVESRGGAFIQENIYDTTITTLSYPKNIIAHNFVSWLHPFKEHKIIAIGEKGMLSFEDNTEEKELFFFEKGIEWIDGKPISRNGLIEKLPYEDSKPLTQEMRYFLEHLNKKSKIATAQNAIEVLEILERASKSLIKSEELKKNISKNTLSSKTLKKNYFVHESSYIDNNVKIGKGTKIWHFSHIQSNSQIGIDCTIGQNVNIASNVKVGNNVKIQNNVSVYEGVELEDFVFCGPSMVFTNVIKPRSEFPKSVTTPYQKTLVKRGATIGANATILCGLTLGKYSFVAAGAVVTSNVPDYALMKGVPAKRTAWVCQCGQKLSENISLFVCLECNRTYKLCNGTLS